MYENSNIKVRFKFADELRRIAEYIQINTDKPGQAAGKSAWVPFRQLVFLIKHIHMG